MTARVIAATNRDLSRAVEEGRFRADLRYRLEVFVVQTPPLRGRGDDILGLAAHFVRDRARALGRRAPELGPKLLQALLNYAYPGNVRELRNMVEQAMLLNGGELLALEDFPVLSRVATGWSPERRDGPAPVSFSDPVTQPYGRLQRESPLPPPPAPMRTPAPPAASEASGEATPGARSTTPEDPNESIEAIRSRARSEQRRQLIEALKRSDGNVTAASRLLGLSRYQLIRRIKKHGLR